MREWLIFIFLGFFAWGASFLWIKIALEDIGPFALVTYRMAFGAVATWILIYFLGMKVNYTRQRLLGSMFVGAVGLALPITLLSWGETRIDSGLAGIINGTVPLWTMIIAHFALHDDRITRQKALGLMVGFFGLIILVGRDVDFHRFGGSTLGQIAVIGMAICYAISIVFTRRYLKGQHPLLTASMALSTSVAVMLIATSLFERPFNVPQLGITWLACAWLGVIGCCLALWAYYHLLNKWGATRSSLVTYVFPVSAVMLGAIFLNEKITWHLIFGGALIIGGIALVNKKTAKSVA